MSGFKEWWNRNYQWALGILGVIVTWVISGIIGFYTAMSAVDADIDKLRERIIIAETELASTKSDVKSLTAIESRLTTLESDFKYVKNETEQVSNANSAIKYLIEVERNKTVNDLKEILKRK